MAVYFSIFLVIITVVTGIIWLLDKYYLAPQRRLKVVEAQSKCEQPLTEQAVETLMEPSGVVDSSIQIFPVIAFVLILRSFLYEPFQIPSGSMMPTLLDGDFILVNKFNYGLRDPVLRHKFFEVDLPERGDVVVFKYPLDPNIDFIKRVIGLPGERIIYRDKTLYIKPVCEVSAVKCPDFQQVEQIVKKGQALDLDAARLTRFTSLMPNKEHEIYINTKTGPRVGNYFQQMGTQRDEFVVPKDHYFVMGDNRDNSADGRYWGFVPEENLVGEAVAIWMSFDFDRSDADWLPGWIPTGVRFNRLGGIH